MTFARPKWATQRVPCTGIGLCLVALVGTAAANDQIPGPPQREPILIEHATLHCVDQPTLEDSSLLFTDGQIVAVGKQLEAPERTKRIDATGQHVYPGLFESMTDLGLREISAVDATDDRTEFGDENANARAWVAINPDSELIPVARAGGVLVAHVVPGGRWIRGQSAVIQLDGWTAPEMTIAAPAGLFVAWSRMHPRDDDDEDAAKEREQKLRELDELLARARRYATARQRLPETTPTDLRLEGLIPVVRGETPLLVEANREDEIESAIAYAQSQSILLVIYGGYDAESSAELLNRYDVPVIVASTHRLPRRRYEPYDAAYTLPERLRRAGVKFAIQGAGTGGTGGAASVRNLPYHAATAVAFGLPREEAIRAITLSPAEILGVADRLGSLTAGKDATLIVCDGDILETASNVTQAFIQGRMVDLSSKHSLLKEKYELKYEQQAEQESSQR